MIWHRVVWVLLGLFIVWLAVIGTMSAWGRFSRWYSGTALTKTAEELVKEVAVIQAEADQLKRDLQAEQVLRKDEDRRIKAAQEEKKRAIERAVAADAARARWEREAASLRVKVVQLEEERRRLVPIRTVREGYHELVRLGY